MTRQGVGADPVLAARTAVDLVDAHGPAGLHRPLPAVDARPAVLAIEAFQIHGPPAWLLAAAGTALSPVLRRRVVAESGFVFGAVEAGPGQYAGAEAAIRRLDGVLARIAVT